MALLMVHLLAAKRFAERHAKYLDDPDFYLGAISPDGIHVRDHDDKSNKDFIHLYNWKEPHPENVVAYWQERATAFDIGYGVHVLTDGQWVRRYRALCPALLLPDGRVDTKTYYHDTFLTDFILYGQDGQGAALFDLVARGSAPKDHPLLTFGELTEWRRMMLDAYQAGCRETGEPVYLTPDYCRAFIEDCQPMMDETYAQCFGGEDT